MYIYSIIPLNWINGVQIFSFKIWGCLTARFMKESQSSNYGGRGSFVHCFHLLYVRKRNRLLFINSVILHYIKKVPNDRKAVIS